MVAVPLLFLSAFLNSKTTQLIDSLETAGIKFLNVLTARSNRAVQNRVENIRAA
jgi:hypothetical protein